MINESDTDTTDTGDVYTSDEEPLDVDTSDEEPLDVDTSDEEPVGEAASSIASGGGNASGSGSGRGSGGGNASGSGSGGGNASESGSGGGNASGSGSGGGNASGSCSGRGSGSGTAKDKPRSTGAKLNGFSYYMRIRRPELEAEGHTFPGGWKDVAAELNQEWGMLPEPLKARYRSEAKSSSRRKPPTSLPSTEEDHDESLPKSKHPNSGPFTMMCYYEVNPNDTRMNSLGVAFNTLKIRDANVKEKLARHRYELRTLLINENPNMVNFILLKFSSYVDDNHEMFVPAEIGLTAFSIMDGITGNFGTLIDACEIPIGYGFSAREKCNKLWLPYPPYDNRLQNFKVLTNRLVRFITHYTHPFSHKKLKVYCMPTDLEEAIGCIKWLYDQVQETCPFEIYSFSEAIILLTEVLSDLQLPKFGGDRVALNEHLVAARRARDSVTETSSEMSFSTFPSTSTSKMSFSTFPSTSTSESASRMSSRASSSTTSFESGSLIAKRYPQYPYSASIASSSRSCRPSGIPEEEWAKVRAGCFVHEQQVQEYVKSLDLAFETELSCLFHMQKDADLAMPLCPLNMTNRIVYNILDALILLAEVEPKLNFHIPSVGINPTKEIRRREEMLKSWVLLIRSEKDFKYDPTLLPPYFLKRDRPVGVPK